MRLLDQDVNEETTKPFRAPAKAGWQMRSLEVQRVATGARAYDKDLYQRSCHLSPFTLNIQSLVGQRHHFHSRRSPV